MATTQPRSRTRQRPTSTITVTLDVNGQRPARTRHTPKVITLDGRSPEGLVTVLITRLTDAVVEELSHVSVSDVVVMASSLITGQPLPAKRAAEVMKTWAVTTGLAICRRVVAPTPSRR
jgi:hypothetical protein